VADDVVRYTSADEDSGRWRGFPFRDGDIVISSRSKTGTTWVQMICAVLIFQTPEATGQPAIEEQDRPHKPVRDWLLDWIRNDASPHEEMDSIRGVLWHDSDAWARRSAPNIVLLHYADLSTDLENQMRQLAARLAIAVPESA
jgi:hypothetical protein